jgi:hypothetical protein
VAKSKRCVDCSALISQPSGRGRPRLRCGECAWLAKKQQTRASTVRQLWRLPADQAEEIALRYYGPPSRDR